MTMSPHIPARSTPRHSSRRRCAASDVNLRIASSSVSLCSSRTYLRRMRGNVPYARGCGCSCPRMPSGDAPEESLSIETHGCSRASATSGSDIPNTATLVNASSSISRSKMESIGSLFQSFAISASVLPCSGRSLGFCTAAIITSCGPEISCHSLSHASDGVSISRRMRSRSAGFFSRSRSFAFPPSCAHGGRKAEKSFDQAV